MNVEEAIKTAIDFEKRIWKAYQKAEDEVTGEAGKRIFGLLAQEEKGHVEYLESQLAMWKATKKVDAEKLTTAVPSREIVREKMASVESSLGGKTQASEVELLQRALATEREATELYRNMAQTLPQEEGRLFGRFLEIEEDHTAIVQAEIDYASRTGNWFDIQEFTV